MAEAVAFDMGRFQRIVGFEHPRITGKFEVASTKTDDEAWVTAIDVTVWFDGRNWGRTLTSRDLKCHVVSGVAMLTERDVADDKLAEVQDVWEAMKLVIELVARAAAYEDHEAVEPLRIELDDSGLPVAATSDSSSTGSQS